MAKKRILSDWVETFMEYTSGIPSPEIYRRWTAYSIIAGALERRVWTEVQGSLLYPNLFILLIGPPAVGKSMAIKEAQALWARCGIFNLAPNGMTKAAFIDQLMEKIKTFEVNGVSYSIHSLLIAAPEFGTLFPEYDQRFLSTLNDIYDCGEVSEDRTRGGGKISVDRPHVHILAGTQPMYLGEILPESAYGQGFTSRIVFVYAGERKIVSMFKQAKRDEQTFIKLLNDLITIGTLTGSYTWDDGAKAAAEEWNKHLFRDAPDHSLLVNYNKRRHIHLMKLAMAAAAGRDNKLHVTAKDFQTVAELLLDAERVMPEIFKEMHVSKDAKNLEQLKIFLFSYCQTFKVTEVPEHKLIRYMTQQVPVNKVDFFIDTMLAARHMKVIGVNLKGDRRFMPLQATLHKEEQKNEQDPS